MPPLQAKEAHWKLSAQFSSVEAQATAAMRVVDEDCSTTIVEMAYHLVRHLTAGNAALLYANALCSLSLMLASILAACRQSPCMGHWKMRSTALRLPWPAAQPCRNPSLHGVPWSKPWRRRRKMMSRWAACTTTLPSTLLTVLNPWSLPCPRWLLPGEVRAAGFLRQHS